MIFFLNKVPTLFFKDSICVDVIWSWTSTFFPGNQSRTICWSWSDQNIWKTCTNPQRIRTCKCLIALRHLLYYLIIMHKSCLGCCKCRGSSIIFLQRGCVLVNMVFLSCNFFTNPALGNMRP